MRHIWLALLFFVAAGPAWALSPGGTPDNAVGYWGVDTATGLPCIVAAASGVVSTCTVPTAAGGGGGVSTATPVAPSQPNVDVSASTALTVPTGAKGVQISCTQDVNWWDDGTVPTATSGQLIPANSPVFYAGSLAALRIIAIGGSGTCDFSYYK